MQRGGERLVEVVVNGQVVDTETVPADGQIHSLAFTLPIAHSSWVAVRQFPQLHTNPVNVMINGQPIRASADSARWCEETIRLLWKNRKDHISTSEQKAARQAYDRAIATYRAIAKEANSQE